MLKFMVALVLTVPMAFGQSAKRRNDGPSLQATLDWLQVTIPLSTAQFSVSYSIHGPSDTTTRTVSASFQSCVVAFDRISTSIPKEHPNLTITETTRYTIPLSALVKGQVYKSNKQTDDFHYKVEPWIVLLDSKSKVILSERREDLRNTTNSESVDLAFLTFTDESLAKRVQEAFNHAAELCRGKEPF